MSIFTETIRRFEEEGGPFLALSASGQLGYGVIEKAFREGVKRRPHMIGADMGSVDPGPYYLGAGKLATARSVTKRDLSLLLEGALGSRIPLVIGSAGTGGGEPHLAATVDILREIAREKGYRFKLATIGAEIPKDAVKTAVKAGRVRSIGPIEPLTDAEVDGAERIVGQMGTEAFLRAIETEPDVIVTGRACDTAIYACLPARLGLDMAATMQMAKIIECASLCCVPGGRDSMLGTLDGTSFVLESMNPARRATPMSVAAHGLYEQADPYSVAEPEGVLYLRDSVFEAIDERRCRVSGARWEEASQLSVKIEGATRVGARAVVIAGTADPVFIGRADAIKVEVEAIIRELVPEQPGRPYSLNFRFYGLGAVGGRPVSQLPEEVGVLVEVIAPSEDEARAVAAVAKQYLLHHGYPGRISTAGNLAFPFTPPEVTAGDAYRFSIYHIMDVDNLAALFPVNQHTIS